MHDDHPIDAATLEGIARDIHDSTGGRLPVCAFSLALWCGVTLRPRMGSEGHFCPDSNTISYPVRARNVRQHGAILHELGHWALLRANEDHRNEWAARYLGGALALPREAFLRDIYACDWDIFALQELHPNASAQKIAIRMTQVAPASSWVWDDGEVTGRYGLDADDDVTEFIDRVVRGEQPLRDGSERGWPLLERGHRRVIVVRTAA